ncbi:MAG: membrane dipeptidase [Azospirillaceae bacterium]|nr:membrane dipeptidase [Azospirillaceae bacterium]
MSATALLGLAACTTPHVGPGVGSRTDGAIPIADRPAATTRLLADTVTIDMNSHAGRVLAARRQSASPPFEPLAEPMRAGGMAVICLSIVTDTPVTRTTADKRIVAARPPEPGELYTWSRGAFSRLQALIAREQLTIITDAASLRTARQHGPAVIVAVEGADFLEGALDRLDEAHQRYQLRQLQLTHYRANELGDTQTDTPVHGKLTDFGTAIIRGCNRLGIVVDIAHATFEMAKQAASVTSRPLILSHTSLINQPPPGSRQITPDHARLVAQTGGVIGIWPPTTIFPDLTAYADGVARMVDIVGVDHVGIGSEMMGLSSASVFESYRDLPQLTTALLTAGFQIDETARILGGNYQRAFEATLV